MPLGKYVALEDRFGITSSTDPKDDFLIAIAQNGQADYLVSRNIQGILELSLENIQMMTPESFLQLLNQKQSS